MDNYWGFYRWLSSILTTFLKVNKLQSGIRIAIQQILKAFPLFYSNDS